MELIPIKYHNKNFPSSINSTIDEVAGNFDSKRISVQRAYSLHTEYSYGCRKLDSKLLDGLNEIKNSTIKGVPMLWVNERWAIEFAEFILRLCNSNIAPRIIEVHPPFTHYIRIFSEFFSVFSVFERIIKKEMPGTKIFIENRSGTRAGKKFLLSNCNDVLLFLQELDKSDLKLNMVIDYPQLFTGENISMNAIKIEKIVEFNKELKKYLYLVGGLHIWGKRKGVKTWTSHVGDLNSYFSNDECIKNAFLKSLLNTFDDEVPRYFVPEVNSAETDLHSIVNDMLAAGFVFK